MKKARLLISTLFKLGIANVAYAFWYRLSIKAGLRKAWFSQKPFREKTDFFAPTNKNIDYPEAWKAQLTEDADKIVKGQLRYYAYHWKALGTPPNWFLNPFNGAISPDTARHWTELKDFDEQVGDIKNIWEASRFEWVATLTRAYVVTKEAKYLTTLNTNLRDWAEKNPLNTGPNWKCGQEASIRVFNLLNAAYFLGQHLKPSLALVEAIAYHLERIAPNIRYAIAQNNNHGTSEAAGLFIGGLWLQKVSKNPKNQNLALSYLETGRRILEERVNKLIDVDGTFSQYSVNYHRVLLDTLCFAEFWRATLGAMPFSPRFYVKAKAAASWMLHFTDSESGGAPNIGSNDGALLLHFHSCDFRDFRPSCQLATFLFHHGLCFNDSAAWNEPLNWFQIQYKPITPLKYVKKSSVFDGKFLIMKGGNSWAVLRLPNYQFRPNHHDVFHFDLWSKGRNIFFDSGSYSYNPGNSYDRVRFKSVKAHNTLNFDGQEQMPQISRFLLGDWLAMNESSDITIDEKLINHKWSGNYYDNHGNFHCREISWTENRWEIEDTYKGHAVEAEIGFNTIYPHKELDLQNDRLTSDSFVLSVRSEDEYRMYLMPHEYSFYYWDKKPGSRLSIKMKNNSKTVIIIELLR